MLEGMPFAESKLAVVLALTGWAGFIATNFGWLLRRKTLGDQIVGLEAERDEFKSRYQEAETRLTKIDPDVFLERLALRERTGNFEEIERYAQGYFAEQADAIREAARVLAEAEILQSGNRGVDGLKDARRFVQIGLAAAPDDETLQALLDETDGRIEAIAQGEDYDLLPPGKMDWNGLVSASQTSIERGNYAIAELLGRRALKRATVEFGPRSKQTALSLNDLALVSHAQGKLPEAEALFRESLDVDAVTIGTRNWDHAKHLVNLSVVLRDLKKFAEAEELCRRAVKVTSEAVGTQDWGYAAVLHTLGTVFELQHRLYDAEELYREALKIDAATIGTQHRVYATHLNSLAGVLRAQGKLTEAEGHFREALKIGAATIGTQHPDYATHLSNLAVLLYRDDRPAEAEPLMAEALAIFEATLPPDHSRIAQLRRDLARIRAALPPP